MVVSSINRKTLDPTLRRKGKRLKILALINSYNDYLCFSYILLISDSYSPDEFLVIPSYMPSFGEKD